MKNGRAMKGHRRICVPVGDRTSQKRPTVGGWSVRCICGWDGGIHPTADPAYKAYRKHLDYVIDECPIRCKRCGVEKPLSQMRRDYRYVCLECSSEMGNEWQQQHPVESMRHKRNHHYLKYFGLTVEEVEEKLVTQGGVCAICGEAFADSRKSMLHVDHDPATGLVRGMLCFNCNAALGSFKDSPSLLVAGIQYLESWKVRHERDYPSPTLR